MLEICSGRPRICFHLLLICAQATHIGLQEWQALALEALAAWLVEDTQRMQPEMARPQAVSQLTAVFQERAHAQPSDTLTRLLDALLRILRRSPRITVCLRSSLLEAVSQAWR